ncbi:hypothetical protein HanXRQr2_Chr05g0226341 [Helianthus annuus]|uniref:Uncharacterized protein n=1 Tax=Helianthus annuus TaxID=4232 RepID=A0A251USB2_HELAN|nr:hypothetical protein HanXRQr2_Chr05g0226341 [Helianthus annuus]KAJ0923640.1 hypothetical protein HanPSC8_Chr05g0218431 [Helianthus annuus]
MKPMVRTTGLWSLRLLHRNKQLVPDQMLSIIIEKDAQGCIYNASLSHLNKFTVKCS